MPYLFGAERNLEKINKWFKCVNHKCESPSLCCLKTVVHNAVTLHHCVPLHEATHVVETCSPSSLGSLSNISLKLPLSNIVQHG